MGAAGSDGSILETPGPFGRCWSTNGAEFCDALSALACMSGLLGLGHLRASRGTTPIYAISRGRAQRNVLSVADALAFSTFHMAQHRRASVDARRSSAMSPRPDLGPKPRLGYAASSIERAAERRADVAALAALENDRRARAYVVAGELV